MKRWGWIVLVWVVPQVALAEIDEVYSPLVTSGELETEYKLTRLNDHAKNYNNAQAHEVEVSYGLSDDLRIGLVGQGQRASGDPLHVEGIGGQVIYTTTHQGDWWLNTGLMAEYVASAHDDNSPDSMEGRFLLSRVQGPVTVNANLILGRELGTNHSAGIGVGANAQLLYDLGNEHFTPGLEWYGDFGKLSQFGEESTQQHYIGPILTGEIAEFGHSDLEYTAGYYWGLTSNSADQGARVELDYGIRF